MLPASKTDAVWSASPVEMRCLTTWPGLPATLRYQEPVYRVMDYPAMLALPQPLPTSESPRYYAPLSEQLNAKERQKVLLRRSVFELVDFHRCLALTDTELLRWYLSLSPIDRAIILDLTGGVKATPNDGGLHYFLQSHPGLELSQGFVYVKPTLGNTSCVQPTVTSNQNVVPRLGSQTYRCETCVQMLEMLPGETKDLRWIGCSNSVNGSEQLCGEACNDPSVRQMAYNLSLTQPQNQHKGSSSSQLNSSSIAAVSLNPKVERCSQRGKPELCSQDSVTHTQMGASTIQAQSEWPVEGSESSELPRVDSMKITQCSDDSIIHPVQLLQPPPPIGPAGEYKKSAGSHVEIRVISEDESDQYPSIMKDDGSILMCKASNNLAVQKTEAPVQPVSVCSDPAEDSCKALHVKSTAEKFTSTVPCAPSWDAAVNIKVERCMSKHTQTEGPDTAEQNIITEVHMADLDCLAEEFIKLQTHQGCREPKAKIQRKDCCCKQRAQQAELTLLTLQYELCRQHIWRLYYTSAEGHLPITMAKDPPPNIVRILQKLETDYNLMKHQILMGVPLEQLSPLSVESEKITTGACYIPLKIIEDVVGKAPSCTTQGTQNHGGAEDSGRPDDEDRRSCQSTKTVKKEGELRRAAAFVPNDRLVKQSGCEEVNISEAWYDAEEELQLSRPTAAADISLNSDMADNAESVRDESSCSVLYVSNLPNNVTQSDVRQLFESFQPSDVSISTLKNNVRVAMVIVDGSEAAEAAVRELNGHRMQNYTLNIRHLSGAAGGGRPSASTCVSTSLQDAARAPTSDTDSRLADKKLINPALLSSGTQRRKVVCILPTAKGTCVPQHFGTMGSLDTLMAELTQLHPDVDRQTILDALMELKATHQGVLGSLPLSTIRDMTSDLLTKSATSTHA